MVAARDRSPAGLIPLRSNSRRMVREEGTIRTKKGRVRKDPASTFLLL